MSNKTLVRILIVVAIGIPVIVELVTFTGMLTGHFGGSEAERTDTLRTESVQIGSELLTETPQHERIAHAVILAQDTVWTFELRVSVANHDRTPYRLVLSNVETPANTVIGRGESRVWSAGETADFTTQWHLPPGERPESVIATASLHFQTDSVTTISRRLTFGKIPIRRP